MKTYDFEESMTAAEEACFNHICGKLAMKPRVNAYISINPGNPDCIVFDIGGGYTGDLNTWPANYMHMRAKMDIYARSRQQVQRTIMRTVRAFPTLPQNNGDFLVEDSNVVQMRLAPDSGNPSEITTTAVETGNDKAPVPCFVATISFDVVFACPRD